MRDYYVLKTDNKNEYFLDYAKPYDKFYMDVYGCDCFQMNSYDYENLEQNCLEYFKTLRERESNIIVLNYGFSGKKYSIKEIAKAFSVSPERIKEIKNRILYRAKRTNMQGYCCPSRTSIDFCTLSNEHVIDYRHIIIDELMDLLSVIQKPKHFLQRILTKNKLIVKYGTEEINGINIIRIEDMDLSVRTHNCLKRAGIMDLIDLLSLEDEELHKIRNLGDKSIQELQNKMMPYISVKDKVNISKINRDYVTIEFTKGYHLKKYKIPKMTKEKISELVYEIMITEYSDWRPIINYNLSTGLINLLLIRGSFFIENILDEYEQIVDELTFLGYIEYLNEFNFFIERFKKYIDSEYSKNISIIHISTKNKNRIISDKVDNTKIIAELYKQKEGPYKRMIGNLFINPNIKIKMSEPISCNEKFRQLLTYDISSLEADNEYEDEYFDSYEDEYFDSYEDEYFDSYEDEYDDAYKDE